MESIISNETGLFHIPESWVEWLDLSAMFAEPRPLEVELGSGDGGFMLEYARGNPDRNFIAVERLLGRIRKLDRRGQRADLTNLRLVRIEAGYFIDHLLPGSSVEAIHIYFPDPWPKRRHHPRRLINAEFTTRLIRVLRPGGTVFLRTDNEHYFKQMVTVFGANVRYQPIETRDSLLAIRTDFEREFNDEGIPTCSAAYQLKD